MISDLANWVLINVLTNTRVFTSLLALIILIVAGFLISDKKPAKKVPSRRILGAVLFVFATFVFLHANIADLADVFTVWAMLVLAGVAVFSFEESRRLREENRQREKRDRKERLLNEIIEWAIDVAKCGSTVNIQPPQPIFSILYEKTLSKLSLEDKNKLLKGIKIDNERIWQSRYMELIFKYQTVDARGEYILEISNLPYFNIYAKVKEVKDNLENTLKLYWNFLKDINDESMMNKVIKREHKLQKSALSLMKESAKIKTKDIG